MTSFRSAFDSNYLKAEHLGQTRPIVTIANVELVDLGSGSEQKRKFAVSFDVDATTFATPVSHNARSEVLKHLRDKQWVLNRINSETIAEIAKSDEIEDWIGHRVELYAAKTEFQGKRVPCTRCCAPTPDQKPKAKAKKTATRPPSEEYDSAARSTDDNESPF